MNKKKEPSSKWDMQWKKPKRQKLNWKIPKGLWIIVGLLILFTGITVATSFAPKKETKVEAISQKKQAKKKTSKSSTQEQTAAIPKKNPRDDHAPKSLQKSPQKPQTKPKNTTPDNSKQPEVKTVYVYKDSPDNNKAESSPSSTPKPKITPKSKSKPKFSSKNVVLNGGFEDGLNHWDSWAPDGQGIAHAATNDHPASGEKILAHWFDRDYRQLSYQIIYNLPNGTYRLTGKARSSGGQADLKLGVKEFDNTVSNEEKYVQLSGQAEPTKWKTFHVDNVVVKAGTAIVFTYSVAGSKQWAAFDDITFYRVK